MKILFINSLYAPNLIGGAERVVQSIAEGVTEAGHQAVVVSLDARPGTRTTWINDVEVYYVGIKNLYWPFGDNRGLGAIKPFWHMLDIYNPLMTYEVARILDKECPDLVHTHLLAGFSTLPWRHIKRRGLPVVHTLHDYYLLCPKVTMFRNGRNCREQCAQCLPFSLPKRRSTNYVDMVTGVSEFTLERHLQHRFFSCTPEKRVIYNGHEVDASTRPSSRQSSPMRFGYLGRIHPTKGIEVLLESTGQLPQKGWRVEVGGTGPSLYEERLRTEYRTPTIRFAGHVNPDVFLRNIDVLVVPSVWHEPLGRVIVEAYGHGVPVMGSRRGGIPELIEEGRTGFLFEPDNPAELASKMRRLMENPDVIGDMQTACLRKARGLLPKRINQQYLEVYSKAMEKR